MTEDANRAQLAERTPYVGAGEDGCRRSAQIDRDEADALPWSNPRQEELHESAERWEDQAYELMLTRLGRRPSLAQLRVGVGSEEWLAAIALLELSRVVRADAERFTQWARNDGRYTYTGDGEDRVSTFHPSPELDWAGWAADVELHGRGWSSTETRLYKIIAALTTGAAIPLAGILDRMDSWEGEVWRILVEWGTGGNNREYPGRYTAVRQP